MRIQRSKFFTKYAVLALLTGIVAEATTAWGQLVDATISDVGKVAQAQVVTPQDSVAPLAPLAEIGPPNTAAVPPTISEPFADPQLNPTPSPLTPPAAQATNFGRGAAGLGLGASVGVTADSFSAAPTMMGDFFGGGVSFVNPSQSVFTSFFSPGTIIAGSGNGASLAFDYGSGTPNDVFTQPGTGSDASGDGTTDRFSILEPIPPTDAPTSPGAGFLFDGGKATYTNSATSKIPANGNFTNGGFWLVEYSYSSQLTGNGRQGVLIAGPDVATRRTTLSENFSPEVRNRCFLNYNFFNNAFGGLGDVSRYVLGMERILINDLMSMEVRLPMAGTYGSSQQIDRPGDRSYELGNATLIGKVILLRSDNYTFTGGTGLTLPLADDAKLLRGNTELLRIQNESVHILPYLALLRRFNQRTFFQAYSQFDADLNGNPVFANLSGGPLQGIGRYTDSTLAHVDVSAHRFIYQNRRPTAKLKGVIANAELHYTGTLRESDVVAGKGVVITNLKKNFNIVNATFGTHLLVGNHLVVTPGMSIPLREGLDRQFDYEAILQFNYLH